MAPNLSTRTDTARRTPPAHIKARLELSEQEVKHMTLRTIHCPYCNFPLDRVYQDSTGHKQVRCRKCKFEGIINLAYFKRKPGGRIRRRRYYSKRHSKI